MSEQFMTRQELAKALSLGVSTVDLYREEGMPAALLFPPRFVFQDCVDWINKRAEKKGYTKKDNPKED